MTATVDRKQTVGIPTSPGRDDAGFPMVLPTSAQASIEGYTGRYLVLLDKDGDTAKDAAVTKALKNDAGITITSVSMSESASIDSRSIADGKGLLFHDLGVAVVNPTPDQFSSVSAAVANSNDMRLMEPERFVYTIGAIDMNYLRGFRDGINDLFDRLSTPEESVAGAVTAGQNYSEAQLTWGLQATLVNSSRETGRGIRVAILDTGIDLAHPDFRARPILHQSFVENETVDDGNGHGTHCAGVACGPLQPASLPRFGVAHDSDLLVAKVLGNSGRGMDSGIIAGIQWAMANKADIISMSLGGRVAQGQNYSAIFEQIAQRALQRNVLIVAAAGNDSNRAQNKFEAVSHPANCPSILAVGAVDRQLRPAWFSNAGLNLNGGKVDIAAPGVDILASWPGTQQYRREDGTSMAAPMVAGVAALFAQRSKLSGNALWAELLRHAVPLQSPARDVGAGLVQAPQ